MIRIDFEIDVQNEARGAAREAQAGTFVIFASEIEGEPALAWLMESADA